uniref:Uncharacterized protein n=1 Tax=Solanum lycopersicum TaxID=4081 RepID=A0A3Q7FJ22_SOLLC
MIRVNHSSSSKEEEEMVRFLVGRDEHDNDEGGPCNSSTSVCKRRRTTAGNFSRGVCGNGHIACAPFCIKIANKCPSCCLPIGYNRCQAMENVLESLKVSGVNNRNGCKEILNLSKKIDHENVYAHFSEKHASSAEHISFNAVHPIYIEKDQRYIILQMRTDVILFIINHASDCVGSVINIIRVGPFKQKRRFSYELVVTDGESSFKLESVEESVPNWSEDSPLKKFLVVPKVVVNSSARLKLNVLIENKE